MPEAFRIILYILFMSLNIAIGIFVIATVFLLFRYLHIKILHFRTYIVKRKIKKLEEKEG
ncbi:hypothetical protein B4U37_01720 [Sutcliffiella horikoshii]|uniref:Uncharacterized protein n=1 Tax=Sutcliffiella horikoshii TaxID=79883 RepID=A0ABM6KEU0_9BACI|nr:hypothetical protein [Sutcliffiella horikoshii]ART74843.1 hypothetical protein B4U37_01720 [Sutcliffiella horikoshii]